MDLSVKPQPLLLKKKTLFPAVKLHSSKTDVVSDYKFIHVHINTHTNSEPSKLIFYHKATVSEKKQKRLD